jgi:5-methylcytosine-specific restriction endonuclease McrA
MIEKTCTKCGETKPLGAFSRDRSRRDGLQPWCKSCKAASNAAYRVADPNQARARDAARRLASVEQIKASHAAYYAANTGKVQEDSQRRRAQKAGVPHEPWTTPGVLTRDDHVCCAAACSCPDGRAIDPKERRNSRWGATVDHVIPIAKGGPDTPANLVAAHMACNSAKGAKMPPPAARAAVWLPDPLESGQAATVKEALRSPGTGCPLPGDQGHPSVGRNLEVSVGGCSQCSGRLDGDSGLIGSPGIFSLWWREGAKPTIWHLDWHEVAEDLNQKSRRMSAQCHNDSGLPGVGARRDDGLVAELHG